jgi:hypothetical protein
MLLPLMRCTYTYDKKPVPEISSFYLWLEGDT